LTVIDDTTTPLTREVADALLRSGWSPLPLPPRAKSEPPKGYTGYAGKYATAQDVANWDARGQWGGNIAIRLPPDVVGVDVDVYHDGDLGLAELVRKYGDLPPTVWSTSREDGSGIALFRVPVGTTLATDPAQGIDMIQAHHRYMVVWPSIHPEARLYQWIDEQSNEPIDAPPSPDDLPDLPWAWVEGLAISKSEAVAAATPDEVREFIASHTEQLAPAALRGVRKRLDTFVGARHDTLVEVSCWALREAAAGHYAAAAAIDEIATWWKHVMDDPVRRDGGEFGSALMWAVAQVKAEPERVAAMRLERATQGHTAAPPANVDPETGEIIKASGRNLPDEFWRARPALEHIRTAAHNRLVSADAVLLAVLARVVMLTPPSVVLPAIVGGEVSLNLFVSIVDPSGGGKTASVNVARDLVPHERLDVVDPILPSSGEGLIEAFFDFVMEEGDDGKQRKVKKQTRTAGLAFVDEGQSLLSQADRSGTTIMETIRSAWMGGDLGQHNAAEERKRWLKPHGYRLSMIVGFQLSYAAGLITDGEGGTPQRFTFALATDPSLDPYAEWPGPIPFRSHPTIGRRAIDFEQVLIDDIRERRIGRSRGTIIVDPLDTHADLRKMKLAAALAVLDGRLDVNTDDWALAEEIDTTSCSVRSWAVEYDREARAIVRRSAVALAVERESAVEDAALARSVTRIAHNVARKVWRDGEMTVAQAWRTVSSRDRLVDQDDVIDLAVARKWLTRSDVGVARGATKP